RSAAARLSSAPCRCFAVLMGLPPTDAAQMEERTLHGAHDPTPTGPGATPACLPLWTRTSRTPTPVPLQPHPLHHVFGECLYHCRLLADMLGVLARCFCNQKEEGSGQVCLASLVPVRGPARPRLRGGEMGKEGVRGVPVCNCLNKAV